MRSFATWSVSTDMRAREYREYLDKIETREDQRSFMFADFEAYEAGIEEGKPRAAETLKSLILREESC